MARMAIFWFLGPGCAALPPAALAGIVLALGASRRALAISAALWCEAVGHRAGTATGKTIGARDGQDRANREAK